MTAMREEPLKDKALEGRLKDYLTTQEKSQQTKGALRPDKALQQLKIFKSHYLKFKEERDNVGKAKEALKLKVARRQHCANHKHVKKLITSFQKGNKLIDNKLVEAKAAGYRGAEMGKHRTQLEEQLWANLQRTPSQGALPGRAIPTRRRCTPLWSSRPTGRPARMPPSPRTPARPASSGTPRSRRFPLA